ncbi:FAD-linked oxidoreductase [Aulographum hederae CBS 113979]|uniref:Proline dehydrogenase n=1 Tax=Aulographum hederae CBS 113979 TaxID=1176131 RepID=A0A6G1HBY1_9PEZI|nr:FAD-linked oxidoreductase [Aulographum hederae CBS 113979]
MRSRTALAQARHPERFLAGVEVQQQCRRLVHTTRVRNSAATASSATPPIIPADPPAPTPLNAKAPPATSILPLSSVLRTYIVTTMSSSPFLLSTTVTILNRMLASKSFLTHPERNPVLRWLLKKTFYAQFCAGENGHEVQRAIADTKAVGYSGVILEYALEVLAGGKDPGADAAITRAEIETWRKGMLETVGMCAEGDFVGLKWSGLGTHALALLKANKPPSPEMEAAMKEVCELAASKNVGLLPGAEEEVTNIGIETWSLELQKRYNSTTKPGQAIMYTTYQCYLKSIPARLSKHLGAARREGYTLGVKLVRGAYLESEPRSSIWPTREETNRVYDGVAEAVLTKRYNSVLQPVHGNGGSGFPDVSVVLATHNDVSVQRAQEIRNKQAAAERVGLYYAQLKGMADEISCKLVQAANSPQAGEKGVDVPKTFKCVCWGTTGQCLNYLLRRAAENKDAAGRTHETKQAMAAEMWRRMRRVFALQ